MGNARYAPQYTTALVVATSKKVPLVFRNLEVTRDMFKIIDEEIGLGFRAKLGVH